MNTKIGTRARVNACRYSLSAGFRPVRTKERGNCRLTSVSNLLIASWVGPTKDDLSTVVSKKRNHVKSPTMEGYLAATPSKNVSSVT